MYHADKLKTYFWMYISKFQKQSLSKHNARKTQNHVTSITSFKNIGNGHTHP